MKNFINLKNQTQFENKKAVRKNIADFMVANKVAAAPSQPTNWSHFLLLIRKPMPIVLIGLVALFSVGGGVTYAAQDALPGQTLYPVKIASENTRVFIEPDIDDRAELELRYAQRRTDELNELASSGELNEELAQRTRDYMFESVNAAEDYGRRLKDEDPEAAIRYALTADEREDEYIRAMLAVPEDMRPYMLGLIDDTMRQARNDHDALDLMHDVFANDQENVQLHHSIQTELAEEISGAKEHVRMLTEALNFAKQIDDAGTREFIADMERELAQINAAIARVESQSIDTPEGVANVLAIMDEIEASGEFTDPQELFREVEDYFSGGDFEQMQYDGPWIGNNNEYGHDDPNHEYGDEFVDPWASEGECHGLYENDNRVECYEDGRWVEHDRSEFESDEFDRGRYDYHNEDGLIYPDDWDFDTNGPYFYGEDNENVAAARELMERYDKDGDGEVDCIGEKDCPGPDDPIWDILDMPCDADCEKWHADVDAGIRPDYWPYEGDEEDRRRDYDDKNPDHFPPPEGAEWDPNYDPANDPYSGEEYDWGGDYVGPHPDDQVE